MMENDVKKILGFIPTRDSTDDFMEIVEEGETMDECYGIEAFKLRRSDIDALLQGKYLYHNVNCYEYAIYLYYDDSDIHNTAESGEQG